MISNPGADLPDWVDVINNPGDYAPVKMNFLSHTIGKRPDGTKAKLTVHQVAETDESDALVFSKEVVDLEDL